MNARCARRKTCKYVTSERCVSEALRLATSDV